MARGLGIKIKSFKPRADIGNYTASVHRDIKRIWQDAARAFVKELVTDAVHIDTGMSAASVLPLASVLRIKGQMQAHISAMSGGPKRGYGDPWDRSKYRSIRHGMALGRNAYKLSFGTPQRTLFHFEFHITVFQHSFHEGTWDSIPKASDAFMETLEAEYSEFGKKAIRDIRVLLGG